MNHEDAKNASGSEKAKPQMSGDLVADLRIAHEYFKLTGLTVFEEAAAEIARLGGIWHPMSEPPDNDSGPHWVNTRHGIWFSDHFEAASFPSIAGFAVGHDDFIDAEEVTHWMPVQAPPPPTS